MAKQTPKPTSSRLITLLLLLSNLLPNGTLSAETGHGGAEDAGNAADQNLSPHASRVLYEAQQLLDRKDYEKAARILKDFIGSRAKEDHCLVEFTLGNALYFCGRKEESLAHYEAAVELDPAYGPVWVNLGQVAYDLKQYGLAAEALAKGFAHAQEAEKDPDLLYYAAVAHILGGHPEKAEPILEDLVSGKHGETDREWFRALLDVYLDMDRESQAERLLYRMIQQYGDEPETWRFLCRFEAGRKNYRMAAVALTICGYIEPLTREEAILLADLYATIKVPALASQYYEGAFASGASSEEYERLASAYMAAHETDEARKTLVEALKNRPTANLWSLVGDLNYLKEDFEGAYYAFEESARLDPKDGRAYLMMGYSALQAKKKEQAADALRKAQGFPKQTKLARQLLKSMD